MRCRLGDVVTRKVDQVRPATEERFRYIEISSITGQKTVGPTSLLVGSDAPSRARQRVRTGDVLVSMTRPNLNAVAIVPESLSGAIASTGFDILRATDRVSPLWLYYRVQTQEFVDEMCGRIQGVVYPAIRPNDIRSHYLPIPPLDIQNSIVAIIETHFSRLDAAVASLTRAKANVKRARASVLKAAVEGRLVPTEAELARAEGRKFEPAAELLERILAERKAAWASTGGRGKYKEPIAPDTKGLPELPEGWCWVTTDQSAIEVRNGYSGRPAETGLTRILRISAVRARNVDRTDHRWLTGRMEEYRQATAVPGDLLVTRYNGSLEYVGVMALLRGDSAVIHPDKLIRVRLIRPRDMACWFEVAFNVGPSRAFVHDRIRTTAGQAGISGADVKAVPIPLPPQQEQVRIVAEVDRRLSVLDSIDASLDANLARCAKLRQAILKRAFEGRLVPFVTADDVDVPTPAAEPRRALA